MNNTKSIRKIPHVEAPKIYKEHDFIDEELVEIPSDSGIIVEMQYPLLGMETAIDKCLVRKSVLNKLLEAINNLPEDITFKIWDAYRPLNLQEEIYYKYRAKLIETFNLKGLSEEEQNNIIRQYVSLPEANEEIPPLHTTGGAIDLTLVKISTGEELNMGVEFDAFSDLTNTDAFEADGMDENVRNNRRILYFAMKDAGFTNLPSEFWHYEYGNRNWGYYSNKPAIYRGIMQL